MTKPIEKWASFVWPHDEEWREIDGYPGYEVSREGRVRSARRANKRLMKPQRDRDGYLYVRLVSGDRYRKWHVHRLVALAFVDGRSDERNFACHRNGICTENHAGNLKWATQAENIADKIGHGTHQIGSKHGNSKIVEADARAVKASLQRGHSARATAAITGVSIHITRDIARGRTWRHV